MLFALIFSQSLNRVQRGLSAIAELLVYIVDYVYSNAVCYAKEQSHTVFMLAHYFATIMGSAGDCLLF